jgi:transcriptional regulator with XRE-family HTH domain
MEPLPLTDALRQAMKSQGHTQKTLAAKLGVAHPVVGRLLTGQRPATTGTLEKVLDALGLDMLVELRPKPVVAPASDPDLETRLWMDTDLSRLGELEPYDWGTAGPPPGERVVFDPEHGAVALPGLVK